MSEASVTKKLSSMALRHSLWRVQTLYVSGWQLHAINNSKFFQFCKTVASILTFILAMVIFPEVQRRAQEELDHVIGFDRLPTLDDLSSLPYVDALCKETVRFVFYR